jgi:uncharacterized protein YjiS (DUF1127 family)
MTPATTTSALSPVHGGYWRTEHERVYRLQALRPQPASSRPAARHGPMRAAGLLVRGMAGIDAWWSRARSRRALLGMSDTMLKDIGLSRADAWREGRKPLWLLLAGLLPMLAGLAPMQAQANDRDLRGTPVPAAACVEVSRSGLTGNPWSGSFFDLEGAGKVLLLRCPLPVNNVDLSGNTDDNDLTSMRVHYRDSDGFGNGATVAVTLVMVVANAGDTVSTVVCEWNSNTNGTGSTTAAGATKACVHDLAASAFYLLKVQLQSGAGITVQFLGVDFP